MQHSMINSAAESALSFTYADFGMQLQLADQLPKPIKDPESLTAVGKWLSVADLEHSLALWACLGVIVTGASHAAVTLLAWQPVTLSLTWTDRFCGTG